MTDGQQTKGQNVALDSKESPKASTKILCQEA